jgi:DNA mismatch repair protein MutS
MQTFKSILFKIAGDNFKYEAPALEAPVFFVDLNLDQIINAITKSKEEYNLKPFFYTSLKDIDAIRYRQEIMQELENTDLFKHIITFAEKMRNMREQLVQIEKLHYKYQKERLFLDVVEIYCEAMLSLANDLSLVQLKSAGLLSFREYLINYVQSNRFTSLYAETNGIIADLSTIKYSVHIKNLRVQVRNYVLDTDYSAEVEDTFEKFKQGAVKDYRSKFSHPLDMNHVEAEILNGVAQLYPGYFLHLDTFCSENSNFTDEKITVFDREIQFYIAWLEYVEILKHAGLKFCYPLISSDSKEVYDYEGFDLALAHKLISEKSPVVTNDFSLHGKERILVVSGPNQGGKTTFARTFGQLHYLACIGCQVPGNKAQLFLYDRLFTHFEKEENIINLRGKLQDDLFRIHEILAKVTPNSIIIMNEIFSSTTLQDALFLSKKIMEKIIQLDLLSVWVTFIDELASYGEKTVSMVGTVIPENPALRTFKLVRKPADGLAYALSIAEKYKLTYSCLKERI